MLIFLHAWTSVEFFQLFFFYSNSFLQLSLNGNCIAPFPWGKFNNSLNLSTSLHVFLDIQHGRHNLTLLYGKHAWFSG